MALACLAGVVGWLWPRPAKEIPVVNWAVSVGAAGLPPVGGVYGVQLAPDGSAILYRDRQRRLWLRRASLLDPILLRGAEDTFSPFWSTDSRHIAFFSANNTKLIRMQVPDGVPQEVAEIRNPHGQRGGTWSINGTMLFSSSDEPYFISPAGGTPMKLELPHLAGGRFWWPEFLPNGEDFLFTWTPWDGSDGELYLARLRNGRVVKGPLLLKRNATAGQFSPSGGGHLLFVKDDDLLAQRLDPRTWKLEGEPRLLVGGVASAPSSNRAEFSVSANGVLAWRPGRAALSQVTWFDRKGNVSGSAGEPWLADKLRLSRDEKHLLAEFWNGTHLLELNRRGYLQVDVRDPIWTPDGTGLLYVNGASGRQVEVLQSPLNGVSEAREVVRLPTIDDLDDISTDGRFLLYMSQLKLYYVRIDGGPDQGDRISLSRPTN